MCKITELIGQTSWPNDLSSINQFCKFVLSRTRALHLLSPLHRPVFHRGNLTIDIKYVFIYPYLTLSLLIIVLGTQTGLGGVESGGLVRERFRALGRTAHSFLPKNRLLAKPSLLQTQRSIRQQLQLSTTSTATPITKNNDDDDDVPSVTLYQYQICPFCNKAKALLFYAGIRYETVEVNPLTKAELKQL